MKVIHQIEDRDLKAIAATMRDRESEIQVHRKSVVHSIAPLISLAADQGRDISLAKSKLDGKLSWPQWLAAFVPELTEDQSKKYERLAREQLTDPRQCIFAFLPPAEKSENDDKTHAPSPEPWEVFAGLARKMRRVVESSPMNDWPDQQQDNARAALTIVWDAMFPDGGAGKDQS